MDNNTNNRPLKDVEIDITKNDNLMTVSPKIAKAPKAWGKALCYLLAGLVCVLLTRFVEGSNLQILFLIAGATLLVVSIILFARPSTRWKWVPTGEIFCCRKYFFNKDDRSQALQAIAKGDMEALKKLSVAGVNQQNYAVVYETKSKSCRIAQLFRYVPYVYVPDTEPLLKEN